MYPFAKTDVAALSRRLNNFDKNFAFERIIPNNLDRKRPGSRVSMSNDQVIEPRSATSLTIPKGLKNSGIFNYQTGHYAVSINPDASLKDVSKSALQMVDHGTSRTQIVGLHGKGSGLSGKMHGRTF